LKTDKKRGPQGPWRDPDGNYGPNGLYPDTKGRKVTQRDVEKALDGLIKKNRGKYDWAGGDSVNREQVRDILIEMGKLDPNYSRGIKLADDAEHEIRKLASASTKTAGWTSSYDWQSKKDVIEHIKRRVVRSPLMVSNGRGGCAMLAKDSNGKKSIFVFLINKEGGEWGYKDMHESMGPYYYEVPLKMLKAADPPENETAQNWREKVRKAQGLRAIKWQPGDLCSVYGNKFEVVSKRKRGWLVKSLANGKLYSAMPRQMEPLR